RFVAAAAVLGFSIFTGATALAQSGARFRPLFDGTLEGWTVENDAAVSVVGGVLRLDEPRGWLRSNERYEDFSLRIEFRFVDDDTDSGIFVRAIADGTFA